MRVSMHVCRVCVCVGVHCGHVDSGTRAHARTHVCTHVYSVCMSGHDVAVRVRTCRGAGSCTCE